MFFDSSVNDIRQVYYNTWLKYKNKAPLQPLEQQLIGVIIAHPEYHAILDRPDLLEQAYTPQHGQSNPFLHMGLHMAIREQISLDRPSGIKAVYQTLLKTKQEALEVEHEMMEVLAECLWRAQRNNCMPDEQDYLQMLKALQ